METDRAGHDPRICGLAMRQGSDSWTRAPREHALATEHGHAALPSGVTREYQGDSSSKRPRRSVSLSLKQSPRPPSSSSGWGLDNRSFHIS
jgi:hypothetical protein